MKQITQDTWKKAPKTYKKTMPNGEKWLMYMGDDGATTYGPVKIIKDQMKGKNL